MKRLILTIIALASIHFLFSQGLTKEERKAALKNLKWSTKEMKKSLKGSSGAQLNFHENGDRWSIQDCLYHIAFSEGALRSALDGALSAPANPAAKAELKATDDQIKAMITSRANRVKTAPPFEPLNTGFKSYDEALNAFKSKREALMNLVKTTNIDMRNHIVELPFAKMDAYQFVLFISGHTNRHTQQMDEVKMASSYPKM